jgi:tetratricopeptide (TPR) repeat protein
MKAMADVFATDANAWRWEMRRTVDRMGRRALPGLTSLRSHSDRSVRSWARSSIDALGLGEPGRAVQELRQDNRVLGELLRAYGETRDMDAMPVVVSFTTHERAQVRTAARWATEQYGQNAIWQLRRVYRNLTESDANRGWSWQRTMEELFRIADARRLEPVREDLAEGKAALARGDLDPMGERFDAVLRRAPGLEGRAELAPGYAALAAREIAGDRLAGAATLYRRAVRLAPDHPEANRWRADVAYVEAELSLARGTVDLAAYEEAVALAPGHPGATRALDVLTGQAEERATDRRRVAAAGAALLLLLAAFVWLRRRRTREPSPTGVVDAAPDTLPG